MATPGAKTLNPQIPKRKRLRPPFLNGNTRYRRSWWNSERKLFRKILRNYEDPSTNITLQRCYHYCENDKALRKRAFSRLLLQSCSYHTTSVWLFRKISHTWNCINKNYMTTEGEKWLNRRKKKRTWWARFHYNSFGNNFLSKKSCGNPSSKVENSSNQLWRADRCLPFSYMFVWYLYVQM